MYDDRLVYTCNTGTQKMLNFKYFNSAPVLLLPFYSGERLMKKSYILDTPLDLIYYNRFLATFYKNLIKISEIYSD